MQSAAAARARVGCKGPSDVRYILGLEVDYTGKGVELRLHRKLLLKCDMIDCHPTSIPLDRNTPLWKLEPGTEFGNINEYQPMIQPVVMAPKNRLVGMCTVIIRR